MIFKNDHEKSMTVFFKWNMFFTSFLPLWISIIINDVWIIVSELFANKMKENYFIDIIFNHTYIEFITVIILSIYIIISVCCINHEIKKQKRSLNKTHGNVVRAKRANKLTAEFLLAYILPMMAFDYGELKDIVLFLIYFCVLSFLCIRNSNVYTNILLELKGYKMYECDIECHIMTQCYLFESSLVISKNYLIQSLPRRIEYFDFDNYIYIDIGENENE